MSLKEKIAGFLVKRRETAYLMEVDRQKNRYAMWIATNEEKGRINKLNKDVRRNSFAGLTIESMPYGEIDRAFSSEADIILFVDKNGQLQRGAKEKIIRTFVEDGGVKLVYGDEDCICADGKRGYPWFKPEFSPDTLLSFFYFGSYFAVHRQDLEGITLLEDGTELERIYDLVLKLPGLNANSVRHISEILYHKNRPDLSTSSAYEWVSFMQGAEYGYEERFDRIKQQYFKRNNIQGFLAETIDKEGNFLPFRSVHYQDEEKPLVSIIIPSKDHPELLKRCIQSVREKTTYANYEVIVMDNGSNEENKALLAQMAETERFYYHYEPMEFNFSRMCNIGVSLSKGGYILLLNDDMEVINGEWLQIMLGQAMQDKCGAVGAKLLYPDSDKIQHVGITNMAVGPSHKLIHLSDKEDYYYGRNHLNYNVIGVTAACLLIKRSIYDEVGGMPEKIQVAYNDAKFCMCVYEAGYYNVIRNDVILYHHESLSRGDDRMDDSKMLRLLQEKETVRQEHTANMENDPFYNRNLAGYRVNYDCNYRYGYEKREIMNSYHKIHGRTFDKWENNCLTIYMDHVGIEAKTDIRDNTEIVLIEGWSYVLGMNNCCYKRFIFLTKETGEAIGFPVMDRYRKDVAEILPDEKNVELAGFVVRVPVNVLGTGRWQIAMLAKDTCSRQYLYKKCDEVLEL